ncbi:MAG: SpoIIE family protein phosphatase [Kouleothrix sp.]|nr:SpoIIE family protein phosphatase [Kouleothrix sp.]
MVTTIAPRRFLIDEAQLLGLLGSQLAQTLERERLHQEALARQRLEQELNLARDIQASFLPACCPLVPGYTIAALYRAARQVGGDFYDFIELEAEPGGAVASHTGEPMARGQAQPKGGPAPARPEIEPEFWRSGRRPPRQPAQVAATARPGRLGIVIADVTDKGVPAALFMALSRTLIRATASDGRAPAAVLEQANSPDPLRRTLGPVRHLLLRDPRHRQRQPALRRWWPQLPAALPHRHRYGRAAAGAGDRAGDRARPTLRTACRDGRAGRRDLLLHRRRDREAMNPRRQLFGEERLAEILRRSRHLAPEDRRSDHRRRHQLYRRHTSGRRHHAGGAEAQPDGRAHDPGAELPPLPAASCRLERCTRLATVAGLFPTSAHLCVFLRLRG